MNCLGFSPNHVNKRAFGEKTSHRVRPISPDGKLRMVSRQRVTASRISIGALDFPRAIATSLLHGDHTTVSIGEENFVAVMLGSHKVGNPCAILTSGRACRSYSVRTIDVGGDSGRAEWWICGADLLMISKNPMTNLKQSLTRSRVGDSWIQFE